MSAKRRRLGWELPIKSSDGRYLGGVSRRRRRLLSGGTISLTDGTQIDLLRSLIGERRLEHTETGVVQDRKRRACCRFSTRRRGPGAERRTAEALLVYGCHPPNSLMAYIREARFRHGDKMRNSPDRMRGTSGVSWSGDQRCGAAPVYWRTKRIERPQRHGLIHVRNSTRPDPGRLAVQPHALQRSVRARRCRVTSSER
jgi:hypothetical protein